jgi:twitching motility protein PilU
LHKLHDLIERSSDLGMLTIDQSLFKLHKEGLITYEDALRNADSVNNLRLRIKLEGGDAAREKMGTSLDGSMTFYPFAAPVPNEETQAR